jgi:aminocarboxymuconate-semialdehyde decarboxylase
MIDRKNRYGRTAARIQDADGLARRPSSVTIDIHAHIVVPQAASMAMPHLDASKIPLAHFADAPTREVNAQQDRDLSEIMTTIDRRLFDLDKMGIDIQLVAPTPGQNYYSIDPKIAETAHRLANDGVAEYCARVPDRFRGLGVVTLQEPELAIRELDYIMGDLNLRGVEILTNVDGQELSDLKFRGFFARAEQLGAFIMMHPNGFTQGERLTHYYLNNVLGGPWRRLSAGLFRPDRSRLGRPGRLPRKSAAAADELSAAGLSGHCGVQLSPAGLSDRCVRARPDPDGHRLSL